MLNNNIVVKSHFYCISNFKYPLINKEDTVILISNNTRVVFVYRVELKDNNIV